jgi:hypothetical protein
MPRVWTSALLLAALTLRAAILARGLPALDRLFIPDDTYYTLTITRSLAAGLGPSADGSTLTSGFQPLLAFLLTPLAWTTSQPDALVWAAACLGALADLVVLILLARLTARLATPRAGLLAAALWALSPIAISNALGGLETTLALALSLACVSAWPRDMHQPLVRWCAAGALVGLCLLARIDTAFLALALGCFGLWQACTTRCIAPLFACVTAACLTVAPWWIYAVWRFGSFFPESGPGVRALVLEHQQTYLTPDLQLAWAAAHVFGSPALDSALIRDVFFSFREVGVAIFTIFIAIIIRFLCVERSRLGGVGLAFGAHAMSIFVVYSAWLPALWFFQRYLAPCHVLCAMVWAMGCDVWLAHGGARRVVAASLFAAGLVTGGVSAGCWAVMPALEVEDSGLHGAKGYREVARQALALVPRGAVVGAAQSGALAWEAPAFGVVVVNLDGVVDGAAQEARRRGELGAYMRARGVTYLADWESNIQQIVELAGERMELERVGQVEAKQGEDRVVVYRVR